MSEYCWDFRCIIRSTTYCAHVHGLQPGHSHDESHFLNNSTNYVDAQDCTKCFR